MLGVLNFAEGRGDRYLAVRHGEGELAVGLLGDVNGFALCVGDSQLVELIACIRGDSYGNRITLFRRALIQSDLAVRRSGCRNGVGRGGTRGRAAGGMTQCSKISRCDFRSIVSVRFGVAYCKCVGRARGQVGKLG